MSTYIPHSVTWVNIYPTPWRDYIHTPLRDVNTCIPHSMMWTHTHWLVLSWSVVFDSLAPGTAARRAPLVRGIPQARILGGLPFPSPGGLPDPGMESTSPALAGGFFTTEPPGKPLYTHVCSVCTMHMHAMEYYSVIKKTEMLPIAAVWMDLEGIMLGK